MYVYEATNGGLRLANRDRPRPGPGEVAIDVLSIALNRAESRRVVQGGFAEGSVPGWDTAGVISEIGPGTTGPPVGSRVVARGLSGGWSECRVAHQEDIAVVPDGIDLGVAATLATAATTALAVLTRNGSILGRTVLITGASGSVGQFAIQLAHLGGAKVIAATRSEADRPALTELGAHEVVSDLAHAANADLVIETLGGPSLVRAVSLLNPGGALQSLGWSSGEKAEFSSFDHLMKSGGTLQGFAIGERRVGVLLRQLIELLRNGQLKTAVLVRRPWADLPQAAVAALQPGFRGKAVLDLSD